MGGMVWWFGATHHALASCRDFSHGTGGLPPPPYHPVPHLPACLPPCPPPPFPGQVSGWVEDKDDIHFTIMLLGGQTCLYTCCMHGTDQPMPLTCHPLPPPALPFPAHPICFSIPHPSSSPHLLLTCTPLLLPYPLGTVTVRGRGWGYTTTFALSLSLSFGMWQLGILPILFIILETLGTVETDTLTFTGGWVTVGPAAWPVAGLAVEKRHAAAGLWLAAIEKSQSHSIFFLFLFPSPLCLISNLSNV